MQGKIGNYEIIKTIGSGASCKVKQAIDTVSGKKVALKIMNDDLDQKDKNLLKTELQAMSVLKHPNIVETL